jgi:hypothetical protein
VSYDDPNRESVGAEPIWTGAGDNVPGVLELVPVDLKATASLTGGISNESYGVDWGDSKTATMRTDGDGAGSSSHTYAAAGTYTVTLKRDDVTHSQDVTVTAPAPPGDA